MAAKKKVMPVKKSQTKTSISKKMTKTTNVIEIRRRSTRNCPETSPAIQRVVKKVVVTKVIKSKAQPSANDEAPIDSTENFEESIKSARPLKTPIVRQGNSLPNKANKIKEPLQKTRRSLKSQETTSLPESSPLIEESIHVKPRRSGRTSTIIVLPDQPLINSEEPVISQNELSISNDLPSIEDKSTKRISNRLRSKQSDVIPEVKNDETTVQVEQKKTRRSTAMNESKADYEIPTPSSQQKVVRKGRPPNKPVEATSPNQEDELPNIVAEKTPARRGRKRKVPEESNESMEVTNLPTPPKEIARRGRKQKSAVVEVISSVLEKESLLKKDNELDHEPLVLELESKKADELSVEILEIEQKEDKSIGEEAIIPIDVIIEENVIQDQLVENIQVEEVGSNEALIQVEQVESNEKLIEVVPQEEPIIENVQLETNSTENEVINDVVEVSINEVINDVTEVSIIQQVEEVNEIVETIEEVTQKTIGSDEPTQEPLKVAEITDLASKIDCFIEVEKPKELKESPKKTVITQSFVESRPEYKIIRQAVNSTVNQDIPDDKPIEATIKILLQGKSNVNRISVKECLKLSPEEKVDVQKVEPPKVQAQKIDVQKVKKIRQVKVAKIVRKKLKHKEIDDCIIRCDVDLVTNNDRARKCKCKISDNNFCQSGSCLNRAMRYECPKRCDYGNTCKNRRFQNREYAKLECFDTEKKGRGLRALEPIKRGNFIIEYIGEIIDINKFNKRSKRYELDPRHKHHYVMSLNANTYIDATKRGNIARFINHSCDPNAATEKWTVDRRNRIGFFALRDIPEGDEIVFDYKFERYGKTAQKCYCGSSNCRGIICAETDDKKDIRGGTSAVSSDSSDDSSSDEFEMMEVDQTIQDVEAAEQEDEPKQVRSKELNENYEKSAFKDYRIPKKKVIQTPVEVVQPKEEIVKSEHSRRHSRSPKPDKPKRKSRFGPLSPQATDLPPPQLIQIRPNGPNSACSNTCSSSSSTPSQPGLTPNYPETSTASNNLLNAETNGESQLQQLTRQHKSVVHAYAGGPSGQSFLPPFPPPMSFTTMPPYYYPMMPGIVMTPEMTQFPFAIPTINFGMQLVQPPPPPELSTSDTPTDKKIIEPT